MWSTSAFKSNNLPAFSVDHMFIDEYGKEYISTFLPVKPWASLTINLLLVKIALSLNVLNAEVELWTRAGHIKINLQKGVDIRKFDRRIAQALL